MGGGPGLVWIHPGWAEVVDRALSRRRQSGGHQWLHDSGHCGSAQREGRRGGHGDAAGTRDMVDRRERGGCQ